MTKVRTAKLVGVIKSQELPHVDIYFNNVNVYSGHLSTISETSDSDVVILAIWDFDGYVYGTVNLKIVVNSGSFRFVDIVMNYTQVPDFDVELDHTIKWPYVSPASVKELKYDFFTLGNIKFFEKYRVEKKNVKNYTNLKSVTLFPDVFRSPRQHPIDAASDGKDNVKINDVLQPRNIVDPLQATGPWHYFLESGQILICDFSVAHPFYDLMFYD